MLSLRSHASPLCPAQNLRVVQWQSVTCRDAREHSHLGQENPVSGDDLISAQGERARPGGPRGWGRVSHMSEKKKSWERNLLREIEHIFVASPKRIAFCALSAN